MKKNVFQYICWWWQKESRSFFPYRKWKQICPFCRKFTWMFNLIPHISKDMHFFCSAIGLRLPYIMQLYIFLHSHTKNACNLAESRLTANKIQWYRTSSRCSWFTVWLWTDWPLISRISSPTCSVACRCIIPPCIIRATRHRPSSVIFNVIPCNKKIKRRDFFCKKCYSIHKVAEIS